MQIADVYTKKEYDCPRKCGSKVYYAKIKDDSGNYVTTDGLPANGKYGKDSNVLSGAVMIQTQDRLHECTASQVREKYDQLTREEQPQPVKITANVRWGVIPNQLSDIQSKLYHGYHELTTVAFMLTKEQHPKLSEDSDTFGMIVHAKSLVLSNILLAKTLEKVK